MNEKTQKQNIELLVYKVDQLQITISTGFKRLDDTQVDLNKRLAMLEIWQSKVDNDLKVLTNSLEKDDNNNRNTYSKLIALAFAALGLVATALTIVLNATKK